MFYCDRAWVLNTSCSRLFYAGQGDATTIGSKPKTSAHRSMSAATGSGVIRSECLLEV